MGEIADPLFRLSQVTEIMGQHYRAALDTGGPNPERVLWLFTEAVIDGLKASAPMKKPPVTDEEALRAFVLLATHDHVTGESIGWTRFLAIPKADKMLKQARKGGNPLLMSLLENELGPYDGIASPNG